MCELLVRIVDKVNKNDPRADAMCLKRGHVVVACPDGWKWSKAERENPEWRIIRVPDMTLAEGEALRASDPTDPSVDKTWRRRAFRIDVDAADATLKQAIDDKAGRAEMIDVARAALAVLVKETAKPIDDRVIGDDPRVIG